MKKYFLSILALLVVGGTKAQKTYVNDANAEPRVITGSFNSIRVSGGIDLFLSQYENEAIAVSASTQEYKKNIKTVVENNTLKIYYDGSKSWYTGNKKIKVYVSFKNLQQLQVFGSSDVQVAGFIKVPSLMLVLKGSSDFKGVVKVDSLTMDLNGASDVKISGSSDLVTIQSSDASDVNAYDLVTDVCNAKASGASDINITVNKEMYAHASGASNIHFRGNAIIKEIHSSGSSSVVNK